MTPSRAVLDAARKFYPTTDEVIDPAPSWDAGQARHSPIATFDGRRYDLAVCYDMPAGGRPRGRRRASSGSLRSEDRLGVCESWRVQDHMRLGDLLDLRDADLLVIKDTWVGYNEASPFAAQYLLRRTRASGLSGEGVFSSRRTPKPIRVRVAMKPATARVFLDTLAALRLSEGPYTPLREHTDDYPRIEIVVSLASRKLGDRASVALLYTTSQGEFHAPWAALVAGAVYVVQDDALGRALLSLDRTLKKSELRRLMKG